MCTIDYEVSSENVSKSRLLLAGRVREARSANPRDQRAWLEPGVTSVARSDPGCY